MKTIINTEVMTFDELSNAAKEKARSWWLECGLDGWSNCTYEDAQNIGLKIKGFDMDSTSFVREVDGEFIISAIECSEKVMSEHGEHCDTYKTAKAFDEAIDALPDLPNENSLTYPNAEHAKCLAVDAIEGEFLTALLRCYKDMLQQEYDYQCSNEHVDETILANKYTFTKDGTCFG